MAKKEWNAWLNENQPEVVKRIEVVEEVLNCILQDVGVKKVMVVREDADDNFKCIHLEK